MEPAQPIIIFGTGRSGTTIFHKMLSEHQDLAWLSNLCDKYPAKLNYNSMLMKCIEYPALEGILRKKYNQSEAFTFWDHYSKGFSSPCRDLLATDVSVKMKRSILQAMSKVTSKKKYRVLLKVTGWPRTGFLNEVFEDAKFIHVIRDGRAVANSLMNVGFWRGWKGPEQWRWGTLPQTYQEEWQAHERSFVALAGIQWKILMDASEQAKKMLGESRILQIHYEELCVDPIPLFKQIADFCDIEWGPSFENRLRKYTLRNTNSK
jgi:hypothetical protein